MKSDEQNEVTDFEDILESLISAEQDPDLDEMWKIVNGKNK